MSSKYADIVIATGLGYLLPGHDFLPYLSNALSATGGSVVVAADGLTTLRDSKVPAC